MIALFPIHWMWVEFDKLELIDSDPALNGTLSLNECTVSQEQGASDQMKELLPKGGIVGKLWIGKADKYHLLRLDPQTRRKQFSGGASDQLIRSYDDLTLGIRFLGARSTRSNETSRHGSFVSSRGPA